MMEPGVAAEGAVGLSDISLDDPQPSLDVEDTYEECDCVDLTDDCVHKKPGRIPYSRIYEKQEDAQSHGYFIPGLPVTAEIVSCERDAPGTVHLFNPFVYTVELEHGPYKWTIQRRYREFHHLHNRLLLFRAAQKVKAPVRRIKEMRHERRLERSLTFDDDTNLKEVREEKDREIEETVIDGRSPRDSVVQKPSSGKEEIEFVEVGVQHASQKSTKEAEDGQNGAAEIKSEAAENGVKSGGERKPSRWSAVAKAVRSDFDMKRPHHVRQHPHRHKDKACKLPHFPMTPESIVSSENRGERRRELDEYLKTVLHIPAYRNHPETAEFLEVSRLSFVNNLGGKTKEGLVRKRPGGRRAFIGWKRFCIEHCAKWGKRWLLVKDSFVAYLDPDTEKVRAILLFDKDFTVRSGPRETEGIKHSILISNLHRNLLLNCESDRKAEEWRQSIDEVARSGRGNQWLDSKRRFGASYPVRNEVWAQWFVDSRSFMAQAANMMEMAREEIFITDWWLSPEIYMKRPMFEGNKWRLDEILKRKASMGVKVFVLLYKEVEMALGINSLYSKRILQGAHKNIRVIRHPDHIPGSGTFLWAHHEKLICVDQNIAFVGGIDLCYGRWDEYHHKLTDLGSVQFSDRSNLETGPHSLFVGVKRMSGMRRKENSVEKGELGGMRHIAAMTLPTTTLPLDKEGDRQTDAEVSAITQVSEEKQTEEGRDEVDRSDKMPEVSLADVSSKQPTSEDVVLRSGSNASDKSQRSKSPLTGGRTEDEGMGKSQEEQAGPSSKRGRFKMWAKKVQRSKSVSEKVDRRKETEAGKIGVGGARFMSVAETQMDFANVVKLYKEYVDSGKAQLEKQRGDTPPPERKHKNRLKNMIRQWRDLRKQKDQPTEEDTDYNETWANIISSAPDDVDMDGSGKLWLGKDYVNFIFKDFVELDMPFMDFIDRSATPRMPWHDIHSVVYGNAARDVARHFIERWNSAKVEKAKEDDNYPFLLPKSYENVQIPKVFKQMAQKCRVQVLRSASEWSVGMTADEDSIHMAYLHMIANAEHFVYIENQFFISLFNSTDVQNGVSNVLYDRIVRAHDKGETFRVFVTLPLMPAFEGQLGATGGSALQAVLYWTYRSISKGPNSLLENLSSKIGDYSKYIVFCGLRTHDELCGQLMTELVYVHSKLIIVDDKCCLIGSANINDRSQLGRRDSEMAIYFEDTEFETSRMNGREYQAGKFAGSLRRYLFKEHLGLLPGMVARGEEGRLPPIDVADPVCDDFYLKQWLRIASVNTDAFEKVFRCIPTDEVRSFEDLTSYQAQIALAQLNKIAAKEQLKRVQGYLVLFPTRFLVNSSLAPSYTSKEGLAPTSLFT